MSNINSSADHLTLNADGASKDIKFQANGVEKASISSAGVMTATSFVGDGSASTGFAYDNDVPAVITNTLASGAIIETGSNANGTYTRYADGTMTCHQLLATGAMSAAFSNRMGTTSGVMYRSSAGWTFPAAFYTAVPRAVATAPIGGPGLTEFAAGSTTSVTVYPYNQYSGTSSSVNIIALGRWK